MFKCTTHSPEETAEIADKVAQKIHEGTVLCLMGDLGVGKTLFVQALARTLGVEGEVTSPTFNLMNIYEGFCPIVHFDLYRLQTVEELDDIGFYEYTETTEGVVVIEWPDRFIEELPEDYIMVTFLRTGEGERELSFSCVGEKDEDVVKELETFVGGTSY